MSLSLLARIAAPHNLTQTGSRQQVVPHGRSMGGYQNLGLVRSSYRALPIAVTDCWRRFGQNHSAINFFSKEGSEIKAIR